MGKSLNVVPSRNNTVISEEQVPKISPIFARVKQLSGIFALSPSTVSKYVKEAEESTDFRHIVYRPSPSILVIEIEGFRDFLQARQKKAFHKINH
ncbi:helix-turn-helix domain-containing protein [Mammaliicoccus sciuri]|uniref:helix-turn-helix domain-containing protein n=1 Tax=Mammaliicoccus sciuri TaxID=1296 RepID=UPI0034DD2CE4